MTNNKIKVALVCSFSNEKVRNHLPLSNRKFYNFGRRLFGLPTTNANYGDVAGWDTYMIELLRRREDIDLTVISAHTGLRRKHVAFDLEGVHYHFVRVEGATLLKHIISSPALWHKLNPMRPTVRKIVKRAQPDIIALIGAENAHISGTVLGIKGIPLIVKCQTIYNNPDRGKHGSVDRKNAYVERLIFANLRYVSVTTKTHERLFRTMNQTAYNFKWSLGNLLSEVKPVPKEYDFVNYAMGMSFKKGFPDAIKALAIVKKDFPDIRLNLVGGCTVEYRKELDELIHDLNLQENVEFTPFFERQEDLFQHIQKARYALLPCTMDYIASTIRQAMHYELPVVCYETEGTVALNSNEECVLVAKNGDAKDLAAKMMVLLEDKERMEALRRNAKEYSRRWNDGEGNLRQMAENFHAVVEHYRNGTPIPAELLYSENT